MILDFSHYIEKIKEHEANRTSFNERQKYWQMYKLSQIQRSETSFDLNKY
jgi:hypothetical protein